VTNEAKGNIVFLFGFLVYVGSLGLGYITDISALKIDIAMAVGIFLEFIGLLIAYRSDKKVDSKKSDKTVVKSVKTEEVVLDEKEIVKTDTKPVKKRTALVLDSVVDEANINEEKDATIKVEKPKTSVKSKTSGKTTKKSSTSKAGSTKKTINIKVNKATKTSTTKKENKDSKSVVAEEKKIVTGTKKTVDKTKEAKTNSVKATNVKATTNNDGKENTAKKATKPTVKKSKSGSTTKSATTKKRAAKK